MRSPEAVTELEGVVLGVLWRTGPATPYAIRQVFLESRSPAWSGSAGAIYPLLRRLERRGLLRSRPAPTGDRPGTEFTLSPSGLVSLREWIGPPIDAAAAGVPPDPLRTRLGFLEALPPARRRALLDAALTSLRAELTVIEEDERSAAERGDVPSTRLLRGALLSMRARIAWISEWGGGGRRHAAATPKRRPPGRRSRASGRRSTAGD